MPNLCCFEDCRKRAYFGEEKSKVFCKEHNFNNFSDIISSKCFCGKGHRIYSYEGQKPLYCKNCKRDDMINTQLKPKCECGKIASFNFFNLEANFCFEHKENDMINVCQRKCQCRKTLPTYNLPGLKAEFCSSCKEPNMISVRHKKCACGKIPSFNYEGLQPLFCKDCKEDDMIDLRSKKCACQKFIASFNFIGLPAKFCSLCKTDGMVCLYIKKCKNEGCFIEGNKKYDMYCTFCFQNLFPLHPLTNGIRKKSKEIAVRDFINFNFDGFQHDKTFEFGGCDCLNRRRIDHRKLINNTLLCIETDENQHKSYDKQDEIDRYNDLLSSFTCKYIFIRFNPDVCTNFKSSLEERLIHLKNEIEKQIERIIKEENKELLEVYYLFFDN